MMLVVSQLSDVKCYFPLFVAYEATVSQEKDFKRGCLTEEKTYRISDILRDRLELRSLISSQCD